VTASWYDESIDHVRGTIERYLRRWATTPLIDGAGLVLAAPRLVEGPGSTPLDQHLLILAYLTVRDQASVEDLMQFAVTSSGHVHALQRLGAVDLDDAGERRVWAEVVRSDHLCARFPGIRALFDGLDAHLRAAYGPPGPVVDPKPAAAPVALPTPPLSQSEAKYLAYHRKMIDEDGRAPTEEEAAAHLGREPRQVQRIKRSLRDKNLLRHSPRSEAAARRGKPTWRRPGTENDR